MEKEKLEKTVMEAATLDEIRAAKKQADINAGKEPVVESPVKEEVVEEVIEKPKKVSTTFVTFKSIDGRRLQLGIGTNFFEGTTINVPSELADEAERILTEGHYLITRIN